ncbi:Dor1-like family-domain-containing protein [Pilobolus umbonatus]|nr:Dor1-like family-domain-containing protein [Pilobolus umbonatus]
MSFESSAELFNTNDDLLTLINSSWEDKKQSIDDTQWTRDYLEHLTSLPLNQLLKEPQQLQAEEDNTKEEAQKLAFTEYPSFIRAQQCKEEVEVILSSLDTQLKDFITATSDLEDACQIFEQESAVIKEERSKITRVLEYQYVLTDLLEIPQLMETCVWNGYYSEAMELASHVRLLLVRNPLPIVKTIQEQVQTSSDLMFIQLISHLRKPIRLAAAINVVGFLRRMDVFRSEIELRMVFLRCKHDYVQQKILRIKRDLSEDRHQRSLDTSEYLKQYIDIMREQMFETGTQYMSIFSNDQGTLLSDYMIHLIRSMKDILTSYLPNIDDTSALNSLLTQLQYCGMSLGRIGLDFRHLFVDLFEDAIKPIILQWIGDATEELLSVISNATTECLAPSSWMASKTVYQKDINHLDDTRRNTFQPPMLLVIYPSLALFTNGVLSAFNALRLLPAISIYEPIKKHLNECFLSINTALEQYSDITRINTPDELTYIQSYKIVFDKCCAPYLESCLSDGIYGNYSISPSIEDRDMDAAVVVDTADINSSGDNDTVDNSIDNTVDDAEDIITNGIKKTIVDGANNSVEDAIEDNKNDAMKDIVEHNIKTVVGDAVTSTMKNTIEDAINNPTKTQGLK